MRIVRFLAKPYRWAAVFSLLLTGFFAFALLDTFVIPKAMVIVDNGSPAKTAEKPSVTARPDGGKQGGYTPEPTQGELPAEPTGRPEQQVPVIDIKSYSDEKIEITIETFREYATTFYVADIRLSDAAYLKTAFAQNTYGRNIQDATSSIAAQHDAIFAVNGDYYGFRDKGYVLRNGVLYRAEESEAQALVIDAEGDFSIIREGEISAQSLLESGAFQIFSFGPALVENGEIAVTESSEVSQSMRSNPRTAIGQVSKLHYIFIVSDGRTSESSGLSLLELAEQFENRGCSIAYNLDGGGSSVMYFGGSVVNNPTDGRRNMERDVSDIVYIGYE